MSTALPLLRGTDEHADCLICPFSRDGEPNKPVYGEGPEDPAFIIIGESPGAFEIRQQRPFCLVPETLVLMADLSWKELENVVIGDEIWAVDEDSGHGWGASGRSARRWRLTRVIAKHD